MANIKSKPFSLPYEPGFTDHWREQERRRSTRLFIKRRLAALDKSPPIAPTLPDLGEHPDASKKASDKR